MAYKDPMKRKAYHKKWYEENKEHKKEYNKKWNEENKEHKQEYNKKWYEENKEHVQEYNKKWNEENREYKQEYHIKWYEENKEHKKEYDQEYYQRPEVIERNKDKKHNLPKWMAIRNDFLKEKYKKHGKLICNHCKEELKWEQVEVDHIKCKALYPELEWDENNFQILCKKCHQIKTNKDLQLIRNEKNNV